MTERRNEHPDHRGTRWRAGDVIAPLSLEDLAGRPVAAPDPARLVHLQFRRFAGCPVCDLHLRAFVRRIGEIEMAGVREVVVFHSSREALLPYAADLPFAVIADPDKRLYANFGVEASAQALLSPHAWGPILRAVAAALAGMVFKGRPAPPPEPEGGRLGLPADFLIASDGRLLACRYGEHAYDQWSADELLALARGVDATS